MEGRIFGLFAGWDATGGGFVFDGFGERLADGGGSGQSDVRCGGLSSSDGRCVSQQPEGADERRSGSCGNVVGATRPASRSVMGSMLVISLPPPIIPSWVRSRR